MVLFCFDLTRTKDFVIDYLITVFLEMKLIEILPKSYMIYLSRKIAGQVNTSLS